MRDRIRQLTGSMRTRARSEYDALDRRKCLRYLVVAFFLPVLASFVVVQIQQQRQEQEQEQDQGQEQQRYTAINNLGLIGFLFNSTAVGVASLVLSLWHLGLRVLGMSVGIGLGLGLAGHVYDALSDARDNENDDDEDDDGTSGGRFETTSFAGRRRAKKRRAMMATTTTTADVSSAINNNFLPRDTSAKNNGNNNAGGMEDANSYHSLMRTAGYLVDNGMLRARMVRGSQAEDAARANDAKRNLMGSSSSPGEDASHRGVEKHHPRVSVYRFDRGVTASARMKGMWPNLAPVINDSLGKLTEFVLRDYVSSWYSKVDEHVVYEDPNSSSSAKDVVVARVDSSSELSHIKGTLESIPAGNSQSFSGGDDASSSKQQPKRSSSAPIAMQQQQQQQQKQKRKQQRTMVLTTTGTQPSPFVDSLYSCFAYLLGMLATRASENVNALELLLLHFPHILAQNLRIYRQMRTAALEKKRRGVAAEREKWSKRMQEGGGIGTSGGNEGQNSPSPFVERSGSFASRGQEEEVSEIAIVREYLLAGRLHRAVTFGLDVPSLLFADPLARDCTPGPSYQENSDIDRLNGRPDEDAVLEDRLLSPESSLISECELDYNRVLASKLSRLVVPKTELDSSIVRTMLVEMLASCVLGPVMGCFCPDSVNGWIIMGLGLLEGDETQEAAGAAAPGKADDAADGSGDLVRMNSDLEANQSSASVVSEEDVFLDRIVDEVMEDIADIASEGSVTSEMEESLFGMDYESDRKKYVLDSRDSGKADQIITLLSMSIIELGSFVDFEESRYAREHGQDCVIDWDAQKCRDSVRHLVLVIEAALLLGVRSHPKRQRHAEDRGFSEFEIEATLDEDPHDDGFEVDCGGLIEPKLTSKVYQRHSSLSAALMELTGDIDAFEKLVADVEQVEEEESLEDDSEAGNELVIPQPNELSTLRSLIAAWLHSGQAFKVLSVVVRAKHTILRRFYHKSAFLRRENYALDFTRLLRQLDGVDILVDTMAVLESKCLLVDNGCGVLMKMLHRQPKTRLDTKRRDPFPEMRGQRRIQHQPNVDQMSVVGSVKANLVQNRNRIARFAQTATEIDLNPFKDRNAVPSRRPSGANVAYHQNNQNTPAYLAFSLHGVFASSLRAERERRKASWSREIKDRKKLDFVCRTRGIKDKDIMMHRELHHLSRFFYSNTNEIRIEPCSLGGDESLSDSAANIIVKAAGTRRKIEVPDEDSTFLLRAQPRPLKPVAIQRDQRNPKVACKVYVALYEEPAIHPKTKRFYGGRYLRQCLMRYYPNDRTASVTVAQRNSVLDGRNRDANSNFALTEDFQKLRHTCLKVATGGFLGSPQMEPGDFCSTPRTGRAVDFAHRVSLFERPMVELGGKKFLVQDASFHRADASSLELSDASMTAALIIRGSSGLNSCDVSPGNFDIQVSDEGTPLVLLRANRVESSASSPNAKDEARPYKPSFIRAALLAKSAKQEAQSQCLLHCIQSGSARSSTKVKSDEWLQPTLTLLQYANSRRQEEQSALLRDLRFGINHIDCGQLSRNGILNPRYPTILRGLNIKVEGVVEVKSASDFDLLGSQLYLFRIRCTAIAEHIGEVVDDAISVDASVENLKTKGTKSRYFREEWTVLRSLRDFAVFHKHIKGQVAPTEHSASAGAKLVGSVTTALTIVGGNIATSERQRGPLVPSLSQATKVGTLGLSTKKVAEKRKKLLDQYLKYLVSPNNLLSRCPELLKFLGAYTAVFPVEGIDRGGDEYGRENISRVELITEKLKAGIVEAKQDAEQVSVPDITIKSPGEESTTALTGKAESMDDTATVLTTDATTVSQEESKSAKDTQNLAASRMADIRAGEIKLKDVRRSVFRLLKHLFDLDNASFFRSRVISVLKTMSLAVASVQDFHHMLSQTHLTYMNGEWVSGWIYYLVDSFWPNGVFYTKGPPPSENELLDLKQNSKKMLRKMFPDQLRTVLGKHTNEGLDMLHEMLQNRLVLKSMAYMIMDLVWAELFPELSDFVTGAECLDKEA